jgi:hypothetical protein
MGVYPGNKQIARIATDVSIADEGAQRTVIKEVAGEDQQAIAAMIPTLPKRSCASSHFRPPTKSRPCPFLDAKATAVHSSPGLRPPSAALAALVLTPGTPRPPVPQPLRSR